MIRRLLLLALFVPMITGAVLLQSSGRANADTGWDAASLQNLILTKAEFTKAVGTIQDTADSDPANLGDTVVAGRYFTSSDGKVMTINLFGATDGSAPDDSDVQSLLNGDFLEQWTKLIFTSVDNVTVIGTLNKDRDFMAQFTGTVAGITLNYSAISFVKGNLIGVIYYGTPGDNDPTIIGAAYKAQYDKLP